MAGDETPDVVDQERELREREQASKEHDPHERNSRAGEPAAAWTRRPARRRPGPPGALGDQLELPDAERAAVVQVEVDAGAVARGQVEDDVEVAYGIASMPAGSMPPIVSTPLL